MTIRAGAAAQVLVLSLSLLLMSSQRGEVEAASPAGLPPRLIRLELPDLGGTLYAPGVVRVTDPRALRRLVIHIPVTTNRPVVSKINRIAVSTIQACRAFRGAVRCEVDLALNQGRDYALKTDGNTIEVTVTPRVADPQPIYARWVIAPPADPGSWSNRKLVASPGGIAVAAELDVRGLEIFEELPDGTQVKLEKGLTAATRLHLRARFLRWEESASLAVRWKGEDGSERSLEFGESKEDQDAGDGPPDRGASPLAATGSAARLELAGVVDLSRGENRLEVEVRHGTEPLLRQEYVIVRRAPSEPSEISGEKWALLVGISNYAEDRLDLRFPHRDAEALGALLVERAGFSAERVRVLTNEKATSREVRSALSTWLGQAKPDDLILIFLAGHGVQDALKPDAYYFLTHEALLEDLGGTAISMWDFGNAIDFTLDGRRVIVLADTCHSGAVPVSGGTNLNFFNKYLEAEAEKKGRLVVTSSQAHESSVERADLGHGVFTHALLRGLEGGADDNPADGVVTAAELLDFVQEKVKVETEGQQHPSARSRTFNLDLPLAYVRRPAG